jgi:hypothetical protein
MDDKSSAGGKVSRIDDYFALKSGRELVTGCLERIEDYASHVERTGRLATWKRAYKNRYIGTIEGSRLRTGGDKNQFVLTQHNHLGNICNHILNNITASKQALTPRANNSDFKSLAQTKVAKNVLTYYSEKGLEEKNRFAADVCLTFGVAYVEQTWNSTDGNDVAADPESGKIIKDGDVNWYVYSPLDVFFDFSVNSAEDVSWYITRRWANKWELAAKYPEYADDIFTSVESMGNMRKMRFGHPVYEGKTDLVPLYTLIHEKNAVMPEGRYCQFVESGDTILLDGPLPHRQVIHRLSPQEQPGSAFGTTVTFDLLPLQEALNMLESVVLTNQAMFGVQTICTFKGSGLDISALDGGMRLLEVTPIAGVDTTPRALNLTNTPAEIFGHIENLKTEMELISGVNNVVRGQPESSLKSGSALALVASQAIQFMSGFQRAYLKMVSEMGTSLIDILKNYAKAPRLIAVSGKYNTQYVPQFTGDDISNIDRVTVEVGNPLAQTTAGKLQIAQDLLQNGMVKDPSQYLSIIETGSIELLTESDSSQILLIKEENEALLDGKQVRAIYTDNHPVHILEHASILSNLDARANPAVVQNTLAHIQEHIGLAKGMDPILAGLLKQPVLNQGPAQPPQEPPQKPGDNSAPIIQNGNPISQMAEKVKMPNMPKVPSVAAQ